MTDTSKPTLKALVHSYLLDAAQPRELDIDYPVDFKTWELEQQLTQLIADIIGETPVPSNNHSRNQLRDEQRQRALERGIDL